MRTVAKTTYAPSASRVRTVRRLNFPPATGSPWNRGPSASFTQIMLEYGHRWWKITKREGGMGAPDHGQDP